MIDLAQADRSLRDNQRDNPRVFDNFRARLRSLENEYQIYLACADDGKGGDITRGGAPLKSFDEWLNS